jgi:hypothetical protein
MAGAAHNPGQEFWQPPVIPAEPAVARHMEVCQGCGTEFIIGSRFCHVCGGPRMPALVPRGLYRYLEFTYISKALGLGTLALVAFVVGVGCLLAAMVTGWVFGVNSTLDWQAIQLWRIQWLLASASAFLAGILLKKAN